MGKRIVIMAGGTGGHVFPALAVAQSLIEKGWQVSWLGTKKGLESRVVPKSGIDIDWLSVSGIRGKGMLSKVTSLFGLFGAFGQAYRILRSRRPDVVLGMGGFVSGPGGLAAKVLGIPLIIHEQNRIPGTTNRLLAKISNKILEAFPDSFDNRVKAVCTGNPLRKNFLSEQHGGKQSGETIKILVFGGSQGAKILNEVVPDAMALIRDVEVRHQTGAVMHDQVAERYRSLGVEAEVTAFIDDMVKAYRWADLVICRSGAMTVSEVAAMGLPAILIPLPGAIDDHQVANARFLAEVGAGSILLQKDLNPESLAERINGIRYQLEQMAKQAKKCARLDATEMVASFCISEAGL